MCVWGGGGKGHVCVSVCVSVCVFVCGGGGGGGYVSLYGPVNIYSTYHLRTYNILKRIIRTCL